MKATSLRPAWRVVGPGLLCSCSNSRLAVREVGRAICILRRARRRVCAQPGAWLRLAWHVDVRAAAGMVMDVCATAGMPLDLVW